MNNKSEAQMQEWLLTRAFYRIITISQIEEFKEQKKIVKHSENFVENQSFFM